MTQDPPIIAIVIGICNITAISASSLCSLRKVFNFASSRPFSFIVAFQLTFCFLQSNLVYADVFNRSPSRRRWLWSCRRYWLLFRGCHVWHFVHTSGHNSVDLILDMVSSPATRIAIPDFRRRQVKSSILPAGV